ncbi:MAG: HD domain-containing phosphohydrolase [Dictyoglomaceae bacterium]
MEKVLIVDDEPFIRKMMEDMLRTLGYEPVSAENGKKALEILEKENIGIVFMDIEMPVMDGITAVKKIREKNIDSIVIMLTAYRDEETMKRSAEVGADDFLTKPVNLAELSARLNLAKKARFFYSSRRALLSYYETSLSLSKETIAKLMEENTSLSFELLEKINLLSEFRDDETHEHTVRVGNLSELIAVSLGKSGEYAYTIKLAAPLHDIGKVGIPDRILLKPGRLTPEEFEMMKKHTIIGERILRNSHSPILKMASVIALTHHERWDGKGYPQGLKGEEIPLEGRIVGVVDAIDAMLSKRPYKDPMPPEEVKKELLRCKGTQFDPNLVDVALNIWGKIIEIEKSAFI